MKHLLQGCVLACTVFAFAAAAGEMTGIVTDAKCKHTDTSEASVHCAKGCIKSGVAAVFIDTASNKVYTISNPAKIGEVIGQKVVVSGEVDGEKITIDTVKPVKS